MSLLDAERRPTHVRAHAALHAGRRVDVVLRQRLIQARHQTRRGRVTCRPSARSGRQERQTNGAQTPANDVTEAQMPQPAGLKPKNGFPVWFRPRNGGFFVIAFFCSGCIMCGSATEDWLYSVLEVKCNSLELCFSYQTQPSRSSWARNYIVCLSIVILRARLFVVSLTYWLFLRSMK